MENNYPHLELTFNNSDYERKKHGGGSSFTERDKKGKRKFYQTEIKQFNEIKAAHEELKKEIGEFIDPNFIFKIEYKDKIHEDTFRRQLRSMGIEVLATSPDKSGFWVVTSTDIDLSAYKSKLQEYSEGAKKHGFFNGMVGIRDIPPNEKVGELLRENPIQKDESVYVDVEVWRMEEDKLETFIESLENQMSSLDSRITDKLITRDFCLLRVQLNQAGFETLLKLKEIAQIDRLPAPYVSYSMIGTSIDNTNLINNIKDDSVGIAVLDSGIISNHPLFEGAVGDSASFIDKKYTNISTSAPLDVAGHGTMVAGIALYEDIAECLKNNGTFEQTLRIYSGKVMYAEESNGGTITRYDEEKLLEHQLLEAVEYFTDNYPNCRVFNLSFGNRNKKMFSGKRQFNLAALIDTLSKEKKIVFVVSAGNNYNYDIEDYPNYLTEGTEETKIIDPASAALVITVGAIAQEFGSTLRPDDITFPVAKENFPSPFTRTGPGLSGMIKPEVVEYGGNEFFKTNAHTANDPSKKIISLNSSFIKDQRLFTVDVGTSYSAPKVAHQIAKIWNQYPSFSPNMVKALLLASCEIPKMKPDEFRSINLKTSSEAQKIHNIYGYGKPNTNRALYSNDKFIVLSGDNKVKLDGIHIYSFYLPKEFIELNGNKSISMTLVYDPPTRKTRIDYLGCTMYCHLYKGIRPESLEHNLGKIKIADAEIDISEELSETVKVNEVKLYPGVSLRKKSVHQKGIATFKRKIGNADENTPFCVVVVCQDRWIRDEDYLQDYSIIVSVSHESNVELYAKVRVKNQVQQRVRT